ncbi:MAG TPA: hypothetical protein ENF38_00690 [Candidatus Aenigmarchaeota archaeon]|nr:hypothetical protein [Candidatus Aenigmarchaeota archaeon]
MFLKNLNYKKLMAALKEYRQNQNCRDFTTELKQWRYQSIKILKNKQLTLKLTSFSLTQLLKRFLYPKELFDQFSFSLQEATINYLLSTTSKKALFRVKEKNILRAVLSTKFVPVDDIVLFAILEPLLKHTRVAFILVTETQTHARFLFNLKHTSFTPIIPGVIVENSEVGAHSVLLHAIIYLPAYKLSLFSKRNLLTRHLGDKALIDTKLKNFSHQVRYQHRMLYKQLERSSSLFIETTTAKHILKPLKINITAEKILFVELLKIVSLSFKKLTLSEKIQVEKSLSELLHSNFSLFIKKTKKGGRHGVPHLQNKNSYQIPPGNSH